MTALVPGEVPSHRAITCVASFKESCSGPAHVQRMPVTGPAHAQHRVGCVGLASGMRRMCAGVALDMQVSVYY
jgi:hypothetical protein